jgi:hypothetical protein
METRERPPPILKTLMAAPLGGGVGGLGASTTYFEDIDGGPLGGDVGGPEAPTTYPEDVDGGPPRRRCQRLGSAHHLSSRRR